MKTTGRLERAISGPSIQGGLTLLSMVNASYSSISRCYIKGNSRFHRIMSKGKEGMLEFPTASILCRHPISVGIGIDRVTLNFDCDIPRGGSFNFVDELVEEFKNHGVLALRERKGLVMLNMPLGNLSVQLLCRKASEFKLRVDGNPSRISLGEFLIPLFWLFLIIKRGGGSIVSFRMSRLDVAIDFPCSIGASLFGDPAKRAKHGKAVRVEGEPPLQVLYYGLGRKIIRVYNKLAEILSSSMQSNADGLVGDVYRFEAQLRHEHARGCLKRNPFRYCPFPALLLDDGSVIPHPKEIYDELFPGLFHRFSSALLSEVENVSRGELKCHGDLQGLVSLSSMPSNNNEPSAPCMPRRSSRGGGRRQDARESR